MLDPMPAGKYELKLATAISGNSPVQVEVTVTPSGGGGPGLLADDTMVVSPPAKRVVKLTWTSDGTTAFKVALSARTDNGYARVLVSAIRVTRLWPMLGGTKRFYEPSLIGTAVE